MILSHEYKTSAYSPPALVNTLCSIMCLILTASTQIRCGIWVLSTIFCSNVPSASRLGRADLNHRWREESLLSFGLFAFHRRHKKFEQCKFGGIKGRRIMLWPLPPRLLSPLNSSRIALITKYKGYSQNHTLFNYCWHITRQLHVLVLTVRDTTEYSPRV